MRILIFLLINIVLLITQPSYAVLFDFDDAPYTNDTSQIEAYMEGIYGSDITFENGRIGDGLIMGPTWDYDGDQYLQSLNVPWLPNWFKITFEEVPFTELSFQWGMRQDPIYVEVDGVEIFSRGYSWPNLSGYSGLLRLSDFGLTSGSEIYVHDRYIGEVNIDDLYVKPVPEPTTMLLIGSGLIGLAGFRRRLKKS